MYRIMSLLFKIFLCGFLLLGMVIVTVQMVGLIIQSGDLVIAINEVLTKTAYILSAIAAVLGFLLHYMKNSAEIS
ncbi:hypothetical protein [Shouchella shacheensis]|uniref:hypothetical protein n=1 Tax=Shouchella shacheensis TaxID=1649580 RepID=UPI000740138A|nr:hypothetical protein [Shouchella shacheensis]